MSNVTPEQSELGKKSAYDTAYNPDKLFPISRKGKRDEIGVPTNLPFYGYDIWNHYEVSWLNANGKPIVALAEIIYGCDSPNIIESKSMKLYFNTFNNSMFPDMETVRTLMIKDLSAGVGSDVAVNLFTLPLKHTAHIQNDFQSECIDELDVECSTYIIDSAFLKTENEIVTESLSSNLLKSNCLVTYQPDWGSVEISYTGKKINREGLLRYIVSFRNHNEFHEQCIERIYMDIMRQCQPEELTVYGRYTRRGGLDINPYRSSKKVEIQIDNVRLVRQ